MWVLNSSNINIFQNKVLTGSSASDMTQGINLANTSETTLQDNAINDVAFGLLISSSKNNKLMDNRVLRSINAVFIKDSDMARAEK